MNVINRSAGSLIKSSKITVGLMLVLAALLICSNVNAKAATYKPGPGDSYDAEGNIVALDGTIVVRADGTVVEDAFKSNNGYTVIGNGTGGTNEAPREIIAGVDTAAAAANTAANAAKEAATRTEAGAESTGAQSTTAKTQSTAKTATSADTATAGSISNNVVTGSGTDAVYSFEGRKYKKASLYGTQRLTGYCADEFGTTSTYSEKTAQPYHTVAAPSDIPLGTVIIVEGKSGPYASKYNGVYVVEDRGGQTLESQGLIDIFCASQAESSAVTDAGWNYADIYIAEAVQ